MKHDIETEDEREQRGQFLCVAILAIFIAAMLVLGVFAVGRI